MEILRKNKKKILIGLMIFISVSLILVSLYFGGKKYIASKITLGTDLYERIHNLYFYGDQLEYEQVEEKYKLLNYEKIPELISKKFLPQVNQYLEITKQKYEYYINLVGKGISNYYGTELKIKKIRRNKVIYTATTKMCKVESVVTYGERCSMGGYYYIEKPFIIVKENGSWKVDEYTSVFEFSDSEFK